MRVARRQEWDEIDIVMKSLKLDPHRGSIRYHDRAGSGPPLIFLHGLGCSSSGDYLSVAADPALTGRRLILIDLLGSGFSDHPRDFGYTIEDHTGTIIDLIRALDIGSFDVFGHSMGGAIASSVAYTLADSVRYLVLGEPNLDPGGGAFSRMIAQMSEADYVRHGHADLISKSLSDGNDLWAASLSLSSPHAVHREATSLVSGTDPSWRDQLYALPAVRTIIFGGCSLPDPDVEVLSSNGIHIEIIPDAGHSMAWEKPQDLALAIARALCLPRDVS
ncbi:alpha/beta hydrolase (plasmid) [Rhizobium sp. CB3171]|uniref:alpha/beta fold hydrolase n=1 Tax=Rhizobium sp. CB3171 TaxID=3039157 RepID=UPI0024B0FFF6|nr:alpha/beta hydrolase [Rhizobium sp. CB3171]WFU05191.1 alpha/beta hydrolase [Rhizobium sp. CB3171]